MRDDYRRGRAAIGALTGRRPAPARVRQPSWSGRLLGMAVGALVIAAIVSLPVVLMSRQGPPPGEGRGLGPDASASGDGQVVTQPSPTRQIIPLNPVWFDSWEEADDYVGWPLHQPTSLPAGFRLTALQAFILDRAPTPPDSVSATFTGEGGARIAFWQDRVTVPEEFSFERSIPTPPADIPLERIEIDDSLGYWMGGVAISDDAGDWIGWDRDVIVLEWQSGDVVYRFQGEGVELADLIGAAESLQAVGS